MIDKYNQSPYSGYMDEEEVLVKGYENIREPREGDLGYDLVAHSVKSRNEEQIIYGTGIKLAPQNENLHTLIFPRSSLKNYHLRLANSVAIIDSSYRGEILLCFKFTRGEDCFRKIYQVGDKIAQLVFFKSEPVRLIQTDILNDTDRGTGAFGSTGR